MRPRKTHRRANAGQSAIGIRTLRRPMGQRAIGPRVPDTGANGESATGPAASRVRLWAVIPAHNEEQRLGATMDHYLAGLGTQDRVVVVVNGSVDMTEAVARSFAARDPRVDVLVEPGTIGKGGALRLGLAYVRDHSAPEDHVCLVDADAAVSGAELMSLCRQIEPGRLVIGSRWMDTSVQIRRQPLVRRVASRTFNRCARGLFGLDLTDTQCPAKALTAHDLGLVLDRLTSSGFAFDLDLILAARERGLAVWEIPVSWESKDGSTVSFRKHALVIIKELRGLHRKYRVTLQADDRPIATVILLDADREPAGVEETVVDLAAEETAPDHYSPPRDAIGGHVE